MGLKKLSFVLILVATAAQAQFIGYVGLQTQTTRVLNASTTIGRTRVNANIGASFHVFTYCASPTVTSLLLYIEESPDGLDSHFTEISPTFGLPATAINTNPCAIIRVGGYYAVLAVHVATLTGGTLSVWYSATAGPADVFTPAVSSTGGASTVLCDRSGTLNALAPNTIYQLEPGNVNQSIYVCGGSLSFNGTVTAGEIQLVWGPGANCGGPGNFAIVYDVYVNPTPNQPFAINAAPNSFFRAPPSITTPANNLCLVVGAVGANTAITFNWAQF